MILHISPYVRCYFRPVVAESLNGLFQQSILEKEAVIDRHPRNLTYSLRKYDTVSYTSTSIVHCIVLAHMVIQA